MNENILIRDMAVCERPRTRLEQVGVDVMSDGELLAVALRQPSIDKANKLLAQRPLRELLTLGRAEMKRVRGIAEGRADELIAYRELFRRIDDKPSNFPVLRTVNDIAGQTVELREKKKEHLLAFFVNARHQLIAKEVISIGTLTASLAHPREIFAPAIGRAAAGVILVHNHPSGDPSPSDEDIRLTQRIKQAGHILGIDLLDHLIVAQNGCYSFKQSGGL